MRGRRNSPSPEETRCPPAGCAPFCAHAAGRFALGANGRFALGANSGDSFLESDLRSYSPPEQESKRPPLQSHPAEKSNACPTARGCRQKIRACANGRFVLRTNSVNGYSIRPVVPCFSFRHSACFQRNRNGCACSRKGSAAVPVPPATGRLAAGQRQCTSAAAQTAPRLFTRIAAQVQRACPFAFCRWLGRRQPPASGLSRIAHRRCARRRRGSPPARPPQAVKISLQYPAAAV